MKQLDLWYSAGLIDLETANRIRVWESEHGRRWPVLLALTFGALLLAAGLLLFVSAHWDQMSPTNRFAVVLSMVASLHVAAALVESRFYALSMALHAAGTLSLGGAIALTGQIFNLSEHWPGGILLWAVGAAAAWGILRQWPQAALAAILIPAWLASECIAFRFFFRLSDTAPAFAGLCALSLVYLGARRSSADDSTRKALAWIGGIALLPLAALCGVERWQYSNELHHTLAWTLAIVLPLGLSYVLARGSIQHLIASATAVVWTVSLCLISANGGSNQLIIYVWYAIGSAALAWWGILESRAERINLGIAGFAFTILFFYFSSVMDKLGRSASLITLGLLFLGGGWLLEHTRRRLIAQLHGGLAQ